jgi:hypothetical protein
MVYQGLREDKPAPGVRRPGFREARAPRSGDPEK